MLTVLSWCGQLRTYEEANLGVDQPIRTGALSTAALAENLVSHGIL